MKNNKNHNPSSANFQRPTTVHCVDLLPGEILHLRAPQRGIHAISRSRVDRPNSVQQE